MVFCHDKFAAGDTFYCWKVWADGSMKYWLWQKRQHSFQHVDPVNLSPQDVVGYVCHGFTDKRQRKERPGPGQTSQLFIFKAASFYEWHFQRLSQSIRNFCHWQIDMFGGYIDILVVSMLTTIDYTTHCWGIIILCSWRNSGHCAPKQWFVIFQPKSFR